MLYPIHPSLISRLDPEYVRFYNEFLSDFDPDGKLPFDPSIRDGPAIPGCTDPVPVASVKDLAFETWEARVFTPEGEKPDHGWPVIVYFYGGGFVFGNIDFENNVASNLCARAKTVVFHVNYRHAPEDPFPAALDDAWAAVQWVYKNGAAELSADISKLAVGGCSSGANLAAVVAHKATLAAPSIPLAFQLLIVTIADQSVLPATSPTSNPYSSWWDLRHIPSLTPQRIAWSRDLNLPPPIDRKRWEVSPMFASDESFRGLPDAWLAVCEMDVFKDEEIEYAEKMRKFGKNVEVVIYEKCPHGIVTLDKYVSKGRQLITDACNALHEALYTPS